MAARLVDGFAGPWKPEQYKDQYAANLAAIIKAKMKGKGAKPRLGAIGPAEPKGEVTDLMERLRATLAANTNARGKGAAPGQAAKPTAKAKRATGGAGARRAAGKHRRAA